jgi:hypothetical protein
VRVQASSTHLTRPGVIFLHAAFHVIVALGMYEILTIFDYNYIAESMRASKQGEGEKWAQIRPQLVLQSSSSPIGQY